MRLDQILLALALVIAAPLSAQRIFVVDKLGKGTHKTVQAAVDTAGDGDWIVITTGAYPENVRIDGKSLWLRGGAPRAFRTST